MSGWVGPEVQARLETEPRLRAFTLFDWLQDHYPGQFFSSQRRTFERRVRNWRGSSGPNREVIFPQLHSPGDLEASEFTHMNALGVTIAGQAFDHMLYHFTLTCSPANSGERSSSNEADVMAVEKIRAVRAFMAVLELRGTPASRGSRR